MGNRLSGFLLCCMCNQQYIAVHLVRWCIIANLHDNYHCILRLCEYKYLVDVILVSEEMLKILRL